jgi:hypothetical protein
MGRRGAACVRASGGIAVLRLRVSTEVEPAVFDEAELGRLEAHVVHRVHKGWISVEIDPGRLEELRRARGVRDTLAVVACEDRLDQLPPDTAWSTLATADAHGLVDFTLEAGASGGRVVVLRLTAVARETCLVRSHLTDAIDIAVYRAGTDARPGGPRPLARHSDGLRDRSAAGSHDWKAGTTCTIAMWVGHLSPGECAAEAGFLDGLIRVKTKLLPFTFRAPFRLGG